MNLLIIKLAFIFRLILKITNKPIILCYHRITKNRLEEQVSLLKKLTKIEGLKVLLDRVYSGKKGFSIAITMDDCYEKDFLNAVEVFSENQVPCTFFVPTQYSEQNITMWPLKMVRIFEREEMRYVDEEGKETVFSNRSEKGQEKNKEIERFLWGDMQTVELEKLTDKIAENNNYTVAQTDRVINTGEIKTHTGNKLLSFQSHTVTHPKLNIQTQEEWEEEFKNSKEYLHNITGEEQYVICYPYGSKKHIGDSYSYAKKHYKYGVTLQAGNVNKAINPMLVKRVGIYEHDTPLRVILKILKSQFK